MNLQCASIKYCFLHVFYNRRLGTQCYMWRVGEKTWTWPNSSLIPGQLQTNQMYVNVSCNIQNKTKQRYRQRAYIYNIINNMLFLIRSIKCKLQAVPLHCTLFQYREFYFNGLLYAIAMVYTIFVNVTLIRYVKSYEHFQLQYYVDSVCGYTFIYGIRKINNQNWCVYIHG